MLNALAAFATKKIASAIKSPCLCLFIGNIATNNGEPKPYANVKAVTSCAAIETDTEKDVSIKGINPAVTYEAIPRENAPMAMRYTEKGLFECIFRPQ
ncbi:protein of unknown function [Xenorhabdus poinarii G6]|uniref:Uncharacterized protein n=1 Tax=Xenorhabdus poinarii G6 TaxID=1354304 RepID=A0A068R631_9GAMM|nr:protein of unknown function [Xenorhabdus poinarii G6]